MNNYSSKRAQGTVEYLIIISIVIAISLVVVGLMLNQTSNASELSNSAQNLALRSGSVGLTDAVASADGNALLVIKNNGTESIIIKKIVVDGVDHVFVTEPVVKVGGSVSLDLNDIVACVGLKKKSYSVVVWYNSIYGLLKKVDYGNIFLDCAETIVPVNDVVKEYVEVVDLGPFVPGAPTNVVATSGDANASVSFDASASDGGSAITGYTVTSSPAGGTDDDAGTLLLTHAISGLTNGVEYTFTVTATNAIGTSDASTPSNAVTPEALSTLTNGLVLLWHLESDATDSSGNGYDGIVNTGVTFGGGGMSGTSANFDGVDGYIYLIDSLIPVINSTDSYTMSAWIKSSASDSGVWQYPVAFGDAQSTDGYFFTFQIIGSGNGTENEVYFNMCSQNVACNSVNVSNVPINEWHHYIGVYDGSTLSLYKDGTFIGSSTFDYAGLTTSGNDFSLGAIISSGDSPLGFHPGDIDEFALWNRTLTVEEIADLYANNGSP